MPILDLLHHGCQVKLTHAAQNNLVERGIVLDLQGRVLCFRNMQCIGCLLCICIVLRTDGETEHRSWQLDRFQVEMVFVMGVVQNGVVVCFIDTRDGTDVPGNPGLGFRMFFAVDLEQLRSLERLASIANEQLIAGLDGALVNTEHSETTFECVDIDHEYMCYRMQVGVGYDLDFSRLGTLALEE